MTHQPLVIDTKMHGVDRLTAAFVVAGERTALVETGPKTSVDAVLAGLDRAGVDRLDWIIVTHIHLDHAGAAGTLSARWPEARVAVHEVGAPHLVDPSKLWSSSARIYGDRMEELWGGIDPIPEGRIHVLRHGDTIDLGGRSLTAFDTPGHAFHHHAYLDDLTGAMFTGDALGVRLPDIGTLHPATPPPEFHLEKAIASINRIREAEPSSLWFTHFGPHDEGPITAGVDATCVAAIEVLNQWAEWVRLGREKSSEMDEVVEIVRQEAGTALDGRLDQDAIDRLEQTTSYRMNTWGYMRYFDKTES